MKIKIYILFLLLFSSFALQAQNVDIPDPNFKTLLLAISPIIDTDKDGNISYAEAEAYEGAIELNSGITNLEGLKAFKNITELNLYGTKITNIDLSQNTKLKKLLATNHPYLESLDVSKLIELEELMLYFTRGKSKIKSLDLSHNKKLTMVRCNDMNSLEWINVANGNNEILESFHFYGSPTKAVIYDSDFDYLTYNNSPPSSNGRAPSHYKWIGVNSSAWSTAIKADAMIKNPVITKNDDSIGIGLDAVFMLEGTKNSIITYTINGKEGTLTLDADGKGEVTVKEITKEQIFITTKLSLAGSSEVPVSNAKQEVKITVKPGPEILNITIIKKRDIHRNEDAVFNLIGTKNAIITYTINGGTESIITLDSNGKEKVKILQVTENQVMKILKITKGAKEINYTGSNIPTETITVRSKLSITVEKGVPICDGVNGTFIVKGKPGTIIRYNFKGSTGDDLMMTLEGNTPQVERILISSKPLEDEIHFEYETLIIKEIIDRSTSDTETENLPVVTLDKIGNVGFLNRESDFTIKKGENITFEAEKVPNLVYAFYVNGEKIQDFSQENTFTPTELKDGYEIMLKVANNTKSCISEIRQIVHLDNGIKGLIKPTTNTIYNSKLANGFSPNEDGKNDVWEIIPNISQKYPKNSLQVFNRSGNVVYNANPYNNDWNGVSNSRAVLSRDSKLPVGAYYFVFDTGKSKIHEGWLYINY